MREWHLLPDCYDPIKLNALTVGNA